MPPWIISGNVNGRSLSRLCFIGHRLSESSNARLFRTHEQKVATRSNALPPSLCPFACPNDVSPREIIQSGEGRIDVGDSPEDRGYANAPRRDGRLSEQMQRPKEAVGDRVGSSHTLRVRTDTVEYRDRLAGTVRIQSRVHYNLRGHIRTRSKLATLSGQCESLSQSPRQRASWRSSIILSQRSRRTLRGARDRPIESVCRHLPIS